MKIAFCQFIISLLFLSGCAQEQKKIIKTEPEMTSTYYFIRHAEKDRSDSTNLNPHLKGEGLERANRLTTVLKSVKFDAVYSTDFNRTRETVTPIAKENNLEITIYDPNTVNAETFLKENKGKNVLVVGHSNTIPQFVNQIIGEQKYSDIEDDNNDNLYVVTVIGDAISDELRTYE